MEIIEKILNSGGQLGITLAAVLTVVWLNSKSQNTLHENQKTMHEDNKTLLTTISAANLAQQKQQHEECLAAREGEKASLDANTASNKEVAIAMARVEETNRNLAHAVRNVAGIKT